MIMKLQVAIDRVTLERAKALCSLFSQTADIVELGTSLIKDYGLLRLRDLKQVTSPAALLADIKTSDEGTYEFRQGFNQGMDILTVMGAASLETLEKCYRETAKNNRTMMIDLLECSDQRIKQISHFKQAIYCLHSSIDKGAMNHPARSLALFRSNYPTIKRVALAGGITLASLNELKESEPDIVIVGSAITKAENPKMELKKFKEAIQ
jgi:3-hexulose-6-phosphate synthase